jgi:hypothetical protein
MSDDPGQKAGGDERELVDRLQEEGEKLRDLDPTAEEAEGIAGGAAQFIGDKNAPRHFA